MTNWPLSLLENASKTYPKSVCSWGSDPDPLGELAALSYTTLPVHPQKTSISPRV